MTTTSVFDQMPLEQIEEASGELHRRAGAALRRIGEASADEVDDEGVSPRRRVATLVVSRELATATLAAAAAGTPPPLSRPDLQPTAIAAIEYGAPTIDGLLSRLEQDRRILASLMRQLEDRLDEAVETAWGTLRLREIVVQHVIAQPARCAQALEAVVASLEAEVADAGRSSTT